MDNWIKNLSMTKQEILDKLIPHYEKCIKEIEEMDEDEYLNIELFIHANRIRHGICFCAGILFKESIVDLNWVNRNIQVGHYWAMI